MEPVEHSPNEVVLKSGKASKDLGGGLRNRKRVPGSSDNSNNNINALNALVCLTLFDVLALLIFPILCVPYMYVSAKSHAICHGFCLLPYVQIQDM